MATGKLRQVEEDAMRITARRFRDNEEDQQYAELKTKPVAEKDLQSPEEVLREVQNQPSTTLVQPKVELVPELEVEKKVKEPVSPEVKDEEVVEPSRFDVKKESK